MSTFAKSFKDEVIRLARKEAKAAVIKGGAKIVEAKDIDRKSFVEVERPVWDKFANTPELKALVQEIANTK